MVCKADLAHLPRLFLDGRGEGPGEQHWVAAVQAIGLSEEQLVSCTILYGLCTKWVSRWGSAATCFWLGAVTVSCRGVDTELYVVLYRLFTRWASRWGKSVTCTADKT